MSIIVTKENAWKGLAVMRGKDWCWHEQDGGAGKRGVITEVEGSAGPGRCKVDWDESLHYSGAWYRIGELDKYELYVYEPSIAVATPANKGPLPLAQVKIGAKITLDQVGCSSNALSMLGAGNIFEIAGISMYTYISIKGKEHIQKFHYTNFLLVEEAPEESDKKVVAASSDWVPIPQGVEPIVGMEVLPNPAESDKSFRKKMGTTVYKVQKLEYTPSSNYVVWVGSIGSDGWYAHRYLCHKADLDKMLKLKEEKEEKERSKKAAPLTPDSSIWIPLTGDIAKDGQRVMVNTKIATHPELVGLAGRELTIKKIERRSYGGDLLCLNENPSTWYCDRFFVHKDDIEKPEPKASAIFNADDWVVLNMRDAVVGARIRVAPGQEQSCSPMDPNKIYTIEKLDHEYVFPLGVKRKGADDCVGWWPKRFLVHKSDIKAAPQPNPYINLADWVPLTKENSQKGARVILKKGQDLGSNAPLYEDVIYKIEGHDSFESIGTCVYLNVNKESGYFFSRFLIHKNDVKPTASSTRLDDLRQSLGTIGKQDFKTSNTNTDYDHTKHTGYCYKVRRPISTIERSERRSRTFTPGGRSATRPRLCHN